MLASACCTVAAQGAPGRRLRQHARARSPRLWLYRRPARRQRRGRSAPWARSASSATARSNAALASAVTTPLAAAVSASPRSASRSAVSPESAITLRSRLDGVVEAAEPQIDRRQHLPAAPVVRILLEMRLDLRDQLGNRALFVHGLRAARPAAGPAVAASRARDKARPRRAAATPARRRRPRGAGASGEPSLSGGAACASSARGDQPARDLDARGLGFGFADQPAARSRSISSSWSR